MQQIIKDDLHRYIGRFSWFWFIRLLLFTPGFKYTYIFRRCKTASWFTKPLWILILRHYQIKYSIQIPYQVNIAKGFRILHFGNIVINPGVTIGINFNISNGALIGNAKGVPTIGNNVVVSANSIIIGNVKIGNDVMIAPGAFVNFDIPDGYIAIGNPAKLIAKEKASAKWIVYSV